MDLINPRLYSDVLFRKAYAPAKTIALKPTEVLAHTFGMNISRTESEKILFAALNEHKIKAIPQYKFIIKGKPYIVDFAIVKKKLVIECDSKIHNGKKQKQKDLDRDKALWSYGWRVVRLANEKIKVDVEECVAIIQDEIEVM